MRMIALFLGTSMLAACGSDGGGGIASGGSVAPAAPASPASNHTFVNPTVEKTYQANGSAHSLQYSVETTKVGTDPAFVSAKSGALYAGDATTVRQSGFTVKYDPRDAIFDINISAPKGNVSVAGRFQDPAHRTDFGGLREPQAGTPQLSSPGIQYLQAGTQTNMTWVNGSQTLPRLVSVLPDGQNSGSYNVDTFFYQKPGTTTQYVTFAGFLRNNISASREVTPAAAATPTTSATPEIAVDKYNYNLSRGAFVFGESTTNANVPKTGTGTFNGTMIATAVLNDRLDTFSDAPTYFQWIEGAAVAKADFGANSITLDLTGNVFGPQFDITGSTAYTVRSGASFGANGTGRIDLTYAGGFLGAFQKAWFVNPGGSRLDLVIAGSSFDGGFYGPKGEEVGGNFRIVGGTPDERIDILGAFTGK